MAIKLEEMANDGAGNAFFDQSAQLYRYASVAPIQAANQTDALVLDPMVIVASPATPTVNIFSYIINYLATGPTVVPGLNTNSQSNGNGYSTNAINSSTAKTPEEILAGATDRAQDKADRNAKKAQKKAQKAQRKADERKEDLRQAQLKEKQARQELATATGRMQRKRLQKSVAKAQRKVNRAQNNVNKYQSLANQAKQQANYLQQRADKAIDGNLIQGVGQYAIDTGKDLSKAIGIGAGFELLRNPEMLSSYLQAIEEISDALLDPSRRAEVKDLIIEVLGERVVDAVENFAQDKDYYSGYIAAAIFDPLGKAGKLGKLFGSVRGGKNVDDLLMPGGKLLGQAGSSSKIREISAGIDESQKFFDQLTKGGQVVKDSNFPGTLVKLPNGGTVGLRNKMTNSPGTAATIDVNIPNIPIKKIKFNP